jgi:hypothetical protein
MREVLSVFTFGIGALCFVVFVTVFQSGDVRCGQILLQKSQKAQWPISRRTTKQATIAGR